MRHILILLLCLILQACGAVKLTYNNADTLLYFWLDGYVDVSVDQKVRVKNELLALQQWHRKAQLPAWVGLTQTLQTQVQGEVTPMLLCGNYDKILQLVPPLAHYLEPSVLWLVTNLSLDQFQSIDEKFVKTNKEWRKDWMPERRQDLIKTSEKSFRERIDPLYGKLSDTQLQLLREAIAASPFDAKIAYAERLRRQQDWLATIKHIQSKKLNADAAKEPMRQLFDRIAESPDPAYRAYFERIRQHNCALIAKLHNSMSASQRTYALEKLQDYERDFKTLQKTQ